MSKKQSKKVKDVKKPKEEVDAQSCCRPFPVPPGGCPDGWVDNGSGICVLNS
jgi:hypothetical protein